MGWNNWNHMMGGYGLFGGGLLSLLVLGLVIVGVVWLVRNSNNGTTSRSAMYTPDTTSQTPLEILDTRYAKGEIDKTEYEERRRDLEQASQLPR